jgi:hypothetical protein
VDLFLSNPCTREEFHHTNIRCNSGLACHLCEERGSRQLLGHLAQQHAMKSTRNCIQREFHHAMEKPRCVPREAHTACILFFSRYPGGNCCMHPVLFTKPEASCRPIKQGHVGVRTAHIELPTQCINLKKKSPMHWHEVLNKKIYTTCLCYNFVYSNNKHISSMFIWCSNTRIHVPIFSSSTIFI